MDHNPTRNRASQLSPGTATRPAEVLQAVDWVLSPVRHGNGKAIEFREDDQPRTILRKQDVEDIGESIDAPPEDVENEEVADDKNKTVTATLYVYGPVFDPKAPMWRFSYRGKHVYADTPLAAACRGTPCHEGSPHEMKAILLAQMSPLVGAKPGFRRRSRTSAHDF